ncbi:hypothetical protein GWI33_011588 [Rhynchophorus ferrugineus]|uniref:CHK kinase-like domain-containing protein n=1 Tax=Rhynchophorus ferrugineus TaxID=354439 RepID=A0A834IBG3_RHYFE|nr:hypothetical protein GWI33_011588 [Rhynchophorus ferrugineus]
MAAPPSTVLNLKDILSKHYQLPIKVLQQYLYVARIHCSKPTLCELRVLTEKRKSVVVYEIEEHQGSRFKTEVDFYNTTIPAMTEFQRMKGIIARPYSDLFPKCIGARISARQSMDTPDDTAIIIFEHLVLANLAEMHATPIAMRIQCLDKFKEKVIPCLMNNNKQPKNCARCFDHVDKMLDELGCSGDHEVQIRIPSVKNAIRIAEYNAFFKEPFTDETWLTLSHSKFSLFNLVLKYNCHTGRPIDCRILDLQSLDYDYCFNDLLFFLLTSAKPSLFNSDFDYLLECYFNSFIRVLTEHGINLDPYTWETFNAELNRQAPKMIFTIMQALPALMCKDFGEDGEPIFRNNFITRLRSVIMVYLVRGWIND